MTDYHWRGRAIFAAVATRDLWHNRIKDYVDGTVLVVEHPDNEFQAGLALQNNIVGGLMTGPAFTLSIKVPESESSTGQAAQLDEQLNDLAEAVAEVSTAFNGIT